MDDKEIDELLNSIAPNKPEKIPRSLGSTGSRRRVSTTEQRQRREALSRLISQGTSNDMIFELMGKEVNEDGTPGFNMSELAVKNLMKEVYAEWAEQDADRKPRHKTMAVRRILREINQARIDKAWTAVGTLEKVLMQIQGTAEPIEINATQEMRVSDALMSILGETDPRKVRELIESERKLLREETAKPIAVLSNGNEVYDRDDENG